MDSKQGNNDKLGHDNYDQLPPELRWENMENGILRKMEELRSAEESKRSGRRRRWIWMVCLLLLTGIAITVFHLKHDYATTDPTVDRTPAPQSSADQTAIRMAEKENELIANGKERAVNAGPEVEEIQPPESIEGQKLRERSSDESALPYAKTRAPRKTRLSGVGRTAPPVATKRPEDVIRKYRTDLNSPGAEKSPTEHHATSALLSPMAYLDRQENFTPLVSQSSAREKVLPAVTPSANRPNLVPESTSAEIWLTGGASWWRDGYGTARPERAAFERGVVSRQAQISYVKPVKKRWFLSVGVQYQQLESRLDWETQMQPTELTLEDTILQVRRNALTGEETEIRGDTTLTVFARRRVRHFNSFRSVQLPIGIGKTFGKGRVQSHLMIGGVANLSYSRRGRTIYQAELLDYDETVPDLWTDKLSFSAMLSGGLNYRLTKRLGVLTSLQYQHGLSNWSTEPGITMRPRILNCSLGLNYSL